MNSVAIPRHRIGRHWAAEKLGHFADEAAYGRFVREYLRGLDYLPAVISTADVDTRFGTVRAYRFGSTPGTLLVLLPGRNASTPMWRANLASLIARRSVYTLDLLGEAGMSVQHKAIADAEDQAAWREDALRRVRVPVLAVIAGRSIIHRPKSAADRARALLPHARVEMWGDASHALNGEFPQRISDITHQFLDGIDEEARGAHSS